MHTFCAGLSEVPEGQWYCPDCAAAAEREDPTAAPASSTAAVGAGDEDAWPELNVADFSDIEELDEVWPSAYHITRGAHRQLTSSLA